MKMTTTQKQVMGEIVGDAVSGGLKVEIAVESIRRLTGCQKGAAEVLAYAIRSKGTDGMFATSLSAAILGNDTASIVF